MLDNLTQPALDFIRGSGWIDPLEAARELVNLAKWGCEWPAATMGQWVSVFDALVESGRLKRRADGKVFIAVDEAEAIPVQMGLFE